MASRQYFVCKVAQRGVGNSVEFVVFVVNTKDIMQWAGTRRVGEHDRGTQRILTPSRKRAIQRFFSRDQRNTIPTSVLVAFDPGVARFSSLQQQMNDCFKNINTENNIDKKIEWGIITFDFEEELEEHKRPAVIVDGQHRLRGMEELEEEVPVLVTALIDAPPDEQAFQFIVINNKAAKVPTDNVKAIVVAHIDEESLRTRLLDAGVDYGNISSVLKDINDFEASPFYHLLDWPINPPDSRIVQLTTIEVCLRYLRSQFTFLENDEDTLKEIFMAIWRSVKNMYDDLWLKNTRFMSKVNINALNEFIAERLAYAWEGDLLDIYDGDQIENQTRNILGLVPREFWIKDWVYKLQDNAVVRKAIKEDLRTISQNTRARVPQFTGLKLIEQEGLE